MKKKLFEFKPRTIAATITGAVLFTLLFMFVKVPSWVPDTDIQTAYGVGAFFAAMFGPVCGGLIAFIGHFLSDTFQSGFAWMSWVIASGFTCFVIGLVYPKLKVDEGIFSSNDMILFNIYQIIANAIAWILIAPILDIVIYAENPGLVIVQGIVAFVMNVLSTGIIGTILLKLCSIWISKRDLKK